jgi:hypothetical protein
MGRVDSAPEYPADRFQHETCRYADTTHSTTPASSKESAVGHVFGALDQVVDAGAKLRRKQMSRKH